MPAFFFIQACTRSSPADGRISWSSSKHRSKKLWASVEMSEGIGGFALNEPIYNTKTSVTQEMRGSKGAKRGSYLEDGLHLVELSPGVFSREHLDDQASDAPYVGLLRVCYLFDNFGSHPIDRALERRTMQAVPWHEVWRQKRSRLGTRADNDGSKTYYLPTFSRCQSRRF